MHMHLRSATALLGLLLCGTGSQAMQPAPQASATAAGAPAASVPAASATATSVTDTSVTASSGTATAATASSEAPLYQVEMVIFRAASAGTQEDWSSVPSGRGFPAPLGSAAQQPQSVHTLAASDYRLDGVVRGLRISGSWRPVAHA